MAELSCLVSDCFSVGFTFEHCNISVTYTVQQSSYLYNELTFPDSLPVFQQVYRHQFLISGGGTLTQNSQHVIRFGMQNESASKNFVRSLILRQKELTKKWA